MTSTFGNKSMKEIKDLINWWFERCIGAHTKIKYTKKIIKQCSNSDPIK
jgi:hypothetical protein